MKTLEASPRYHSPMVNKIYHNGWHILFEPQDPMCFGVIRAKKVTTVLFDWRYWRILFISLFWGHQRPVQFSIAISNPAKGVDGVKNQAAAIWNSGFFSLEGNFTYWYVWTLIRPSKTILNSSYCRWGPWPQTCSFNSFPPYSAAPVDCNSLLLCGTPAGATPLM